MSNCEEPFRVHRRLKTVVKGFFLESLNRVKIFIHTLNCRRKVWCVSGVRLTSAGQGNKLAKYFVMHCRFFFKLHDVNPLFQKINTHIHSADRRKTGIPTKLLCDWFMPPKMTAATIDLLSLGLYFFESLSKLLRRQFVFLFRKQDELWLTEADKMAWPACWQTYWVTSVSC